MLDDEAVANLFKMIFCGRKKKGQSNSYPKLYSSLPSVVNVEDEDILGPHAG